MKVLFCKIEWIWRHGGSNKTCTCLDDCRGKRSQLKKALKLQMGGVKENGSGFTSDS